MPRGYGHSPSGSLLPTGAPRRNTGPQMAEGQSCPIQRKKKEELACPPVDNCSVPKSRNCCVVAKRTLLSDEEYAEWHKLYMENCKDGVSSNPERFWTLSRRLHLWRDGFTSDPTYQKMRAKYFDRVNMMSALACGLSEFVGTFFYTFFPVLIIAAVPLGLFDAYGPMGPAVFALCALVASIFSQLFSAGSYFEPTTTLLLFWFSDDFTIKKHRKVWPTIGRVVGQVIGALVGAAMLLILWKHGSERFERVAQIVDYPNFWESPDTNDDLAGPGGEYGVMRSLFVVIICTMFYNLSTFAVHVIGRSTIADYTTFNMIRPVLIGLAAWACIWGQWNITRGSGGMLKWFATELVLVGHWAYGDTSSLQSSAWVIPIGVLASHVLEVLTILAFGWLYKYSGFVPKGYSCVRANSRAMTRQAKTPVDDGSDTGSESTNSSDTGSDADL